LSQLTVSGRVTSKGCNKSPEVKSVLCVLHLTSAISQELSREENFSGSKKRDRTPVKVDHTVILHLQTSQAHVI